MALTVKFRPFPHPLLRAGVNKSTSETGVSRHNGVTIKCPLKPHYVRLINLHHSAIWGTGFFSQHGGQLNDPRNGTENVSRPPMIPWTSRSASCTSDRNSFRSLTETCKEGGQGRRQLSAMNELTSFVLPSAAPTRHVAMDYRMHRARISNQFYIAENWLYSASHTYIHACEIRFMLKNRMWIFGEIKPNVINIFPRCVSESNNCSIA